MASLGVTCSLFVLASDRELQSVAVQDLCAFFLLLLCGFELFLGELFSTGKKTKPVEQHLKRLGGLN